MSADPDDPEQALTEVLDELATLAKRRGAVPNHYHARDVLVALGRIVLERGDEAAAPWVPRLQGALEPFPEAFAEAAAAEIAQAAEEHVRSVDPRFLQHPRYDFAYTVAARERLEARFVAADLLGLEPDEALLERVAEADGVLEPYLAGGDGAPTP